jgi:hypothetical protein
MNKLFLFATALFTTLSLVLPVASQAQVAPATTYIRGFVYNASDHQAVPNASVSVTCGSETKGGTTNSLGKYSLTFNNNTCNDGDMIGVHATSGELQGNGGGEVEGITADINIGMADVFVSQVPEFGLVTGAIALLTSGGSYLALKRKRA